MGTNWGKTAPPVPFTLRTGGRTLPLALSMLTTGAVVELVETMATPFAPLLAEHIADTSMVGLALTCTTARELGEGEIVSTTCKAGTGLAAAGS